MPSTRATAAALLLLSAVFTPSVGAEGVEKLRGKSVLARHADVKLWAGREVVGQPPALKLMGVAEVNGNWLRVGQGWVHVRQIIPTDEAVAFFSARLQREPSAFAYASRAAAWLAEKDFERAVSDCGAALLLDRGSASAYGIRGAARLNLGDQDQALRELNRSLQLAPSDSSLLCARGTARLQQADRDGALQDLNMAIRGDPLNSDGYIKRSLVWLAVFDGSKARQDLDRALQLDRFNATAYLVRAWAWHLEGNSSKALEDVEEAIHLDSDNIEASKLKSYFQQVASFDGLLQRSTAGDSHPAVTDDNEAYLPSPADEQIKRSPPKTEE